MTDDLDALRNEIDTVDREIVNLLNRRAKLGLAAGKAKVKSGLPIADTEREREVMIRVAMSNSGPLPQDALLSLYRQLIETIRRLEEIEKSGSKPA
jgi:chorismate mutase/prephenate dehydratase